MFQVIKFIFLVSELIGIFQVPYSTNVSHYLSEHPDSAWKLLSL